MRVSRLAYLLVAALAFGGCSIVLVDGPQKRKPFENRPKVICTTSYAAPILDTVLASAALVASAYSATRTPDNNPYTDDGPSLVVAGGELALAALFGGSAIAGYSRVNECLDEHDRR